MPMTTLPPLRSAPGEQLAADEFAAKMILRQPRRAACRISWQVSRTIALFISSAAPTKNNFGIHTGDTNASIKTPDTYSLLLLLDELWLCT